MAEVLELKGELQAGLPCYVVALEQEAASLPNDVPVLITGVGKVRAALAVARLVDHARRIGKIPSVLINLGTAGGLHDGMSGIYEVSSVIQNDYDDDALHAMTGRHDGPAIDLTAQPGFSEIFEERRGFGGGADEGFVFGGEGAEGRGFGGGVGEGRGGMVLATGDRFVAGGEQRKRLERIADLVDMEGYAVAAAALAFDVPVRIVKLVSDPAGEGSDKTWQESLEECADRLAAWVRDVRQ